MVCTHNAFVLYAFQVSNTAYLISQGCEQVEKAFQLQQCYVDTLFLAASYFRHQWQGPSPGMAHSVYAYRE